MLKKSVYVFAILLICSLVCMLPVTGNGDIIPPEIISTYPADYELYVPIDISEISITFSEPIQWDPGTSVHLLDWDWAEVPIGTISISSDWETLIIPAPASPTPWLKNWDWGSVEGIYDLQV
jgi:hypothetical protein